MSQRIEVLPLDAQLHVQRAELERQHADWPAALADYERAGELDPTIDMDLSRGRTLLESGQPREALPLLERFLAHSPEHPPALLYRARALVKLDRRPEALKDYRAALKYTPLPEPDLVRETADIMAADGLQQEALDVICSGIEKLGAIPALTLRAMDLEIATQNFPAALRRSDTMQQTAPRPEPWMARRASILAQAGRIDESRAEWLKLVDHLASLPNLERGSHAMSSLLEDAVQALASLDSVQNSEERHAP